MKTVIVAVVGRKKSGKTTTVEALVRELSKRGRRIAAVKHVSEPDFTIDTAGKDTWRFAQSGARKILLVSSSELVTIEKGSFNESLVEILARCRESDVIIMEGFRKLVGRKEDIQKVVAVSSTEEAQEAVKRFSPILAFSGPHEARSKSGRVPWVDALRDPGKLADLVDEAIKK